MDSENNSEHKKYVSASNAFSLFYGGVLAAWLIGVGAGCISRHNKQESIYDLMPEIKVADSIYNKLAGEVDEKNPRYHALMDSIRLDYERKVRGIEETYRENGLLTSK